MNIIEKLTFPFNHEKYLSISIDHDFTASYYYKGKLLGEAIFDIGLFDIKIEDVFISITEKNEIFAMTADGGFYIQQKYIDGYSYEIYLLNKKIDFETDSKGNIVKGTPPFDLDISNILELENEEVKFYLKLQNKI
ncbi:hypothetical protein [Novacetimonas hansenii]|uniref:Uncharacterized protein n=1 Tax=Novacetimonas hansenii TaxID=436 RepID=A0ABQ0SHG1_NOVHA|nr:hypothetical protein [Novacetimonas hansenii]GAN84007.1 hypothetical protein Gaha_0122_007 [Novacetimonas hansenii JCM 7643]GBQ55911.1 hypothetical protein AA0243_1049 [Novacetimonas hansenii NRIC 0243]GEC64587.1 hypothetical protein GHA01_24360 [Novacetimonas hansenii]